MEASAVGMVILAYKDYENSIACLQKLHAQCELPGRIILCDNGSGNSFVDAILDKWGKIALENGMEKPVEVFCGDTSGAPLVLLRNEENLGIGGGINQALRFLLRDQACESFWILHNDTLPEPYALSALLGCLKKDEKNIGMVGSTLLFMKNNLQECAAGGSWKHWTGKSKLLDSGYDKFAHTEYKEIIEQLDYINGASCLITRKLIDSIGLYDERFCFFYEDVDYGLRAKKAGFTLDWATGSIVKHHAPHSRALTPVLSLTEEPELTAGIHYFYIRNRFYLLRRENPWAIFFALLTLPISSSHKLYKGQKGLFKIIIRAVLDGINRKMDKKIL